MSFSTDVKLELAHVEAEKKCCRLAEIAGFFGACGRIDVIGGQGEGVKQGDNMYRLIAATDNPAIARHYIKLVKSYFKIDVPWTAEEYTAMRRRRMYILCIEPEMKSEHILREMGMLLIKEGSDYLNYGIYSELIKTKCCRKSYLRGAFLAAGTVNDPDKSYHLEFDCKSRKKANDMIRLIGTFDDLSVKSVKRKGRFAVYMKNSQYISDMLAIMGAHSQVLKLEDIKIKKGLVNEAMRITNCDTANTDRVLDASQRQIKAIKKIRKKGKMDSLPMKLRETAELRIENPEVSMTRLGELMNPPLKKSGVNGRMKKIEEFAARL